MKAIFKKKNAKTCLKLKCCYFRHYLQYKCTNDTHAFHSYSLLWHGLSVVKNHCNKRTNLAVPVSSLWLINQMTSKKVWGICVPDPFMGRRGMWVGDRLPRAEITTLRLKYVCQTNFLLCVCARMWACVRQTVFSHAKGQDKDTKNRSNSKWQRREGKKGEISHYQREKCNTHTHTKQSHVSITSENIALTDILEIKSNRIHAIIKAACAIPNVQPDFKLGFYRVYWFMFSRHLAP